MTPGEGLAISIGLKKILIGMQFTREERDDGWWETSEGADFGKAKWHEVAELINSMVDFKGVNPQLT